MDNTKYCPKCDGELMHPDYEEAGRLRSKAMYTNGKNKYDRS